MEPPTIAVGANHRARTLQTAEAASALMSPAETAIEFSNVSFSYGSRKALQGVSFRVAKKEIFGLLGPNGGGKTTLFRILCTLLKPEAGSCAVVGRDVRRESLEVRRRLGVVFQTNTLDAELTVRENLVAQGHLYGLQGQGLRSRVEDVLKRLGLGDRSRDRVKALSGGLRRRLELAKGLLHGPEVLVLDEPTVGVDPGVRHDFWNYLKLLREQEGMTILLTTHLMEEADRCDRLAILSQGRILASGTPDELKARVGGDVITIQTPDPEVLQAELQRRFGGRTSILNGKLRMEQSNGHEFVTRVVEAFPGKIQSVTVGKPTLEDVFVRETGHQFWTESTSPS